jgi:hypothetical protein
MHDIEAPTESALETLREQFSSKQALKASSPVVLKSSISELDTLLDGGIRPGCIVEWGLPPGSFGRRIPVLFLRGNIPPAVWIYSFSDVAVYAPAWASRGVVLSRIFFIQSDQPFTQLRPIFLEDSFKIIIIDAPRRCSKGELAFAVAQARLNRQIIFLIRNRLLSVRQGNTFAQIRINCSQYKNGFYRLDLIKGRRCGKICLSSTRVDGV